MQTKTTLFFLFVLSQMVVLTFYHFDAVDKIGVVANYSRQRWDNSSSFYEFVFTSKEANKRSNKQGFLSSIGESISDTTGAISEWIKTIISERFVADPPPSYLTNGEVKDKPFAPQIREQVFLLILITSHPKASSRRTLIRKTWAGTIDSKGLKGKAAKSTKTGSSNKNVYCVFTMGFSNDVHLDKHVETEFYKFGDIIRVDSKEEYKNLVTKIWGAFGWAIGVHPKYVLKADDDVYVNIPQFINWLKTPELPANLYAGFVHYRAFVYRNHGSRWFVSRVEFPASHFPNYCAGPFYVFTGSFLKKLYANSQRFKRFQVEDAYFGVVAKSVGLKPYHAGSAFLLDNNLHNTLTRIPDSRFKELCVLGHGLLEREIEFIHGRYVKIAEKDNKKG